MPKNEREAVAKPNQIAALNGEVENENIPSKASIIILLRVYFVRPAKRGSLLYSRAYCGYPTQLVNPRIKRRRSGMLRKAATTVLSNKRKSPASRGTVTSEKRLSSL